MTQPRRTRSRAKFETLEPVRYSLPPGYATEVHVQTLPKAVCTVRRGGDPDGAEGLRVLADDEGVVRLHMRPSNEHSEIAELRIDAEAGGRKVRVPLHIRASARGSRDMPRPPARARKPVREGATVRPALGEREVLRMNDEALREAGYPVRPHPAEAPGAFNAWRRAVSTPTTIVEPRLVAHPDLHHGSIITAGPATSNNWSGFELRGATGTYDWVTGMWNVPNVTGESNSHTYSAFWIGLDGDGVSDLVQAGTEQENYNFNFWFFTISISVYYAWTEFLPQQATEQQISNFPINPGDEIFCEVWMGNAGSAPTLSGAFGVLLVENLTTSESTTVYTPVGTTVVGGSEAVWIMERPSLGTALTDLADYASARMFNAYARKANSSRGRGYVPYQGANNLQITMINGATTLSTVTPIDTYSMRFDWQHFH
jgi:peptidase A4-like protein